MTVYNYYVSDTKTKKKQTKLITLQLSYTTRAHTAYFWPNILQSEELIIIALRAHRETEETSEEGRQIEECK